MGALDLADHKLGDSVAAIHKKRLCAEIEKDNTNHASVIGVDGSRRIEHADAVLETRTRATMDTGRILIAEPFICYS